MNKYLLLLILTTYSQTYNSTNKPKLKEFSHNKFSQWGEDGIIQKIFEIIGTKSKICLEVGAGKNLDGNVSNLWKNFGWKAILIEGDPEKIKTLEPCVNENCTIVKSYIEKDETLGQTIDLIVTNLGIKENLDLLSLDIDGNDYYIFENLKIRPRVLIIEFNPTIPYYRDIYQMYTNHSWEIGCSVASLKRLAQQKNYTLVALTDVNAIFVEDKYADKFKNYETSLEKLFNTDYLKNIIHSYSGDPLVVAKINHLCDGFFKEGYPGEMNCDNCYFLRINQIDINNNDLKKNLPNFTKVKP